MITQEQKQRIADEMLRQRTLFEGSDTQFAKTLDLSHSVFSGIKNGMQRGNLDGLLQEGRWWKLGAALGITMSAQLEWKTAKTATYVSITAQLEAAQRSQHAIIFCDDCGIGKTYTAQIYARTHKNAIYIDCGQCDNERHLIKAIAKAFGVDFVGKFKDVYETLVVYLTSLAEPLIILDEFGDLNQTAMMRVKKLINRTKGVCGFYMIGADGLREKMRRGIEFKKEGYAELFDRMGNRVMDVVPKGQEERKEFLMMQALQVIKANAPEADAKAMLAKTEGRLRRVYIEVSKLR